MGCGTGKTLTTLTYAQKFKNVVVLAPPKVVQNKVWEKEIAKFNLDVEVTVISMYKKDLSHINCDLLVVDECHRLKGWKTAVSKRVREIAKRTKHTIGLTGTPVSNGYWDVFNMAFALDVPMFSQTTCKKFMDNYYNMIPVPNVRFATMPTSMKSGTDLFKRVDNFCFSYHNEYSDYSEDVVMFECEQSKEMKQVENNFIGSMVLTPLTKINYLRQLANGFYYDEDKKAIDIDEYKIQEFYNLYAKVKSEGHRVLVVNKFVYDRSRIILQEDDMFLQEQASESLNLQEYTCVIFLSPTYSYQNYEQARKRILRKGQTEHCLVYTLCRKGTIDEVMLKSKNKKLNASDLLNSYLGGN